MTRLAAGGRIDRTRPYRFRFNGKAYTGYEGDSLASALLANGVHLVGRSVKFHRPRGIFSCGIEEPNALVRLVDGARTTPNCRATMVALTDGLIATSQNCFPTVNWDVGAVAGLVAPLLPAGFYNKTFMWPPKAWRFYEYWIRRAAGLGRAPTAPDPDGYAHRWAHCDVLVVGGGPAGLIAAGTAAATGARVILADEQTEFGGSLLSAGPVTLNGSPATDWITATVAHDGVTLLPRTVVTGSYNDNFITAVERPEAGPAERLWKIRADTIILATGAIERPLLFADNDRPGIMLAGAVRSYLNRYGVLPGSTAIVATNNDSAYATAMDLARAGAGVAIVDSRVESPHAAEAQNLGIEILFDSRVSTTSGRARVRAALVRTGPGHTSRRMAADLIAVSGGWQPTVHLAGQARGRLRFDRHAGGLSADQGERMRAVGGCNGATGLAEAMSQGFEAGRLVATALGLAPGAPPEPPTVAGDHLAGAPSQPQSPVGRPDKIFVDLQNDVTLADLHLAQREGYGAVEHLKRYTTTGMGTDQGKTSNPNALEQLAAIQDLPASEIGHTTFRPPYAPVTFGAIAGGELGDRFAPIRRTPMQERHDAAGAVFEDVGQWKRPRYYPRSGEDMAAAVARECRVVREGVGVLDASTLGKIDIQGPDALTLIDQVYCNGFADLDVGRCRYALMLNDDGMVFDDGVATRLGPDHYHLTTTSGGAAHVLAWLEEWRQTEWPHLEVYCTSVTEQWAVASISGPRARDLLSELTDGTDMSGEAFGHMQWREGQVAGLPARVFRVSYTGELSYEINVAARHGGTLWDRLIEAGASPFGTEAMHVLRAEKGYILVGQETDGTVTPGDLGLGWALSGAKDFIGRRSLKLPALTGPDRKQLVGLETGDPMAVLPEGAQLVAALKPRPPMDAVGHVTSSYMSATLGRSIALGLVEAGRARLGETLHVPLLDGRVLDAVIRDPVFYDRKGERARG